MTEQELRAMVRDSIARHLAPSLRHDQPQPTAETHAAFVRLPLVRGGDDDGMCVIEPTVRCTHCGYCQSFGH